VIFGSYATGAVVLQDGRIMGGDSFFDYTGSYLREGQMALVAITVFPFARD
jgi:hypothetical protein